jgi:4-amino-4-deoxy-L-arabinose transferase-like glycosyltransferase
MQSNPRLNWPRIAVLIGSYCLVWTLIQWLSEPNLDSYFDMLENHAWSYQFEWGTFKHPPFFSWTVGAWFALLPATDFSYKLFAYVNVAVALLGVAVLAKQFKLPTLAYPAVLLLLWTFPYSTLAAKFNANTQLLPLWPWTAVVFFYCLEARGFRRFMASVLLGLMAAACMLSKYFSGVFLISFLIILLLQTSQRRNLLSPWPYIALFIFLCGIYPHYQWLESHQFITFEYAQAQGHGFIDWLHILKFAFMPVAYWLPSWLICAGLFAALAPQQSFTQKLGFFLRYLVLCWRPKHPNDALFWLCATPLLSTLVLCIFLKVSPEAPWAIPLGFGYTLLWLRNLSDICPIQTPMVFGVLWSWRWRALFLLTCLSLAATLYWALVPSANLNYYRPTQLAAEKILQAWRRDHSQTPLVWSSGSWGDNAMMGFYADPKIKALPYFPNSHEAMASPLSEWERSGGVVICPLGTPDHPHHQSNQCVAKTRAWLTENNQSSEPQMLNIARTGWRFPHPLVFSYAVFHYVPKPSSNR